MIDHIENNEGNEGIDGTEVPFTLYKQETQKRTIIEDGQEKTTISTNLRLETEHEKQERIEKEKALRKQEEQELQEEMKKVDINKHKRTLIVDTKEEKGFYSTKEPFNKEPFIIDIPFYRLETDEEMCERIARDKLDRSDRGTSWKDSIIYEMKQHNDSWDRIEKIEVASDPDENLTSRQIDPNDIDLEFSSLDIRWYDILWDHYGNNIPEYWEFTIFTKDRVYTNFVGERSQASVLSVPRNY